MSVNSLHEYRSHRGHTEGKWRGEGQGWAGPVNCDIVRLHKNGSHDVSAAPKRLKGHYAATPTGSTSTSCCRTGVLYSNVQGLSSTQLVGERNVHHGARRSNLSRVDVHYEYGTRPIFAPDAQHNMVQELLSNNGACTASARGLLRTLLGEKKRGGVPFFLLAHGVVCFRLFQLIGVERDSQRRNFMFSQAFNISNRTHRLSQKLQH